MSGYPEDLWDLWNNIGGNYGFPGYNPEMQEQDDPQKYQSGWNPPQGASGLTSPVDNTVMQAQEVGPQQNASGLYPNLGASGSAFSVDNTGMQAQGFGPQQNPSGSPMGARYPPSPFGNTGMQAPEVDPQQYSGWNPPQGASGLTSPVDNTGTQEPRSSSQQYSGRNPILGASQSPFANHPSRQASTATPSWKGQKRPRRQNSACVTCCQGKRACVRPEDDSEKTCKRCTQLSIECKPQTANSKREFRDANALRSAQNRIPAACIHSWIKSLRLHSCIANRRCKTRSTLMWIPAALILL